MTSISGFDFHLPQELIAQRPAKYRDGARLMKLGRFDGAMAHLMFTDFPDLLSPGDVLVMNNTKVIQARLAGKRENGGKAEVLLVRDLGQGVWRGIVRGLAKIKVGGKILFEDGAAKLVRKQEDGMADISFGSSENAARIMETCGQTPLPPYIKREGGAPDREDIERYQTVFAKVGGSCAAPTAGLHLTPQSLEAIRAKGVVTVEITLHVGPGTFKPVRCEEIEDHRMDPERYLISEEAAGVISSARANGGRVVAVGSTSIRALESSYIQHGGVMASEGETALFIRPGFEFKVVDAVLTNFHLPKSTLLILMSAFAGKERILSAYKEAVERKYRFFSYGDAIFIV